MTDALRQAAPTHEWAEKLRSVTLFRKLPLYLLQPPRLPLIKWIKTKSAPQPDF